MTDPITFNSASPRFALPFLFAGQAQKEFYLNEVAARADILLHPAIKGIANSPPLASQSGDCWLVGNEPAEGWDGKASHLAGYHAGQWLFVAPRTGMTLFNEASGQMMRFADGWQIAASVASPEGGSVIDSEARTAINGLIAALVATGLLPNT